MSNNARGAVWMTIAMAGYVINDAFIKLAAEDLPLFEAIFLRGIYITAVIGLWTWQRGDLQNLRLLKSPPVVARIVLETVGTVAYLTALTKLPLAGLTAVMQIVPIAVTFAAARLIGEPVSARRVGAVLIGFVGVLLIVQPWSDAFSPWFALGLVAVAIVVARELATKKISSDLPTLPVALATAVAITTLGFAGSAVHATVGGGLTPPTVRHLVLLAAAGTFLTVGYIGSIVTVRAGDLSFSAPFRYTVLIVALALEIVVFKNVPDATTFLGSAIIVAAGLWVLTDSAPVTRPEAPHALV